MTQTRGRPVAFQYRTATQEVMAHQKEKKSPLLSVDQHAASSRFTQTRTESGFPVNTVTSIDAK